MIRGSHEVEFAGHGRLLIRVDPPELVFLALDGARRSFPQHPLLAQSGALRWVRNERRLQALLGRTKGESLHLFDARTRRFRSLPLRERFPGVAQLELWQSADLFLARTENGLLAVDGEARELWCIERITYDWRFVSHSSGSLWFADSSGNLLGFDPATGHENF